MEIQVHPKVVHQVAAKNIRIMNYTNLVRTIIITILAFSIFTGCVTQQGQVITKDGNYNVHISKSNSSKDPIVYGRLHEYNSDYIIKIGIVKINDSIIHHADTTGEFSFRVKSGRYSFKGRCIGNRDVKSKKIRANLGDSIKIDFYLKQDTTKFVDPPIHK
ncbi:hypothetical protein [Pedobacter sp. WC2423]|uniref:hypothetical protein n=1 Tax=Pedobacter sp. WC2423 TaxID=3234142 RepID=UPI0034669709